MHNYASNEYLYKTKGKLVYDNILYSILNTV